MKKYLQIIQKINNIYKYFIFITTLLIILSIASLTKLDIFQKISFYMFGCWITYMTILCFYCTIKKIKFKSTKILLDYK